MKFLIVLLICSYELFAFVGKVYAIRGEGDFVRASKNIPITLGAEVQEKDVIKTSKNTKIQVIFKDQTILTIGRNTHFTVNRYLFDKTQNSKLEFVLKKGVFKAITGKLGQIVPHNVKVLTKNATIGIRGTTFVVRVSKAQTTLATISGATTFLDKTTNVTHIVPQNQQLTRDNKTAKIRIKPLDQRTIRLGKKMIKSQKGSKTSEEAETDSSVVASDSSSESSSEDDSGAAAVATVENTVASEQSNNKVAVKTTDVFTYGYWETGGMPTVGFHDGIAVTSAMVANYTSGSVYGFYSGNVAAIRDGVVTTNGTFNINADFFNLLVDGNMQFTDSSSETWSTTFSGGVISGSDFALTSGQVTQSGGTVTLDSAGSSIDGTFYGTGTTSPINNQDGVGGTFLFKGTDSTGTTTTTTGSFGGTIYSGGV